MPWWFWLIVSLVLWISGMYPTAKLIVLFFAKRNTDKVRRESYRSPIRDVYFARNMAENIVVAAIVAAALWPITLVFFLPVLGIMSCFAKLTESAMKVWDK